MLINEAADALYLRIASARDIDVAMTKGVNYPKGLLAWCDELGAATVLARLDALYARVRRRSLPRESAAPQSGGGRREAWRMSADPRREQEQAEAIVRLMLARDEFSRWLGISVVEIAPRRSVCRMTVRAEMVNGFGVVPRRRDVRARRQRARRSRATRTAALTMAIENSIGYPAASRWATC